MKRTAFGDRESTVRMQIYVPKVKISAETDLKKVLKKLGASDIFSPNLAKLNMTTRGDDYLDSMKTKTVVEFSENGVKAAAATNAIFINRFSKMIKISHIENLFF